MIVYWALFAIPAVLALIEQAEDRPRNRWSFAWLFMSVGLALLIGFRWETGGDWSNYADMVTDYYWVRLIGTRLSDPGFDVLLWLAAHISGGMLIITGASGVLMAYALTRFCLAQPRPWLAMVVSIPFLVIIMGMGYIRQGMAVSFLLLAILSLTRHSVFRFAAYLAGGALFHSTAAVLAPFAGLIGSRYRALTILMGIILTIALAATLLFSRFDQFQSGYVEEGMSSAGAGIRLLMTALASGLFLLFAKRLQLSPREMSFWRPFAIVPLILLAMLPIFSSSTVLDRLGLYFLPIQTFMAGRLPDALSSSPRGRYLVAIAIIALYALSFFVWLNYAVNVSAWLPYRFYFFEDNPCLQC